MGNTGSRGRRRRNGGGGGHRHHNRQQQQLQEDPSPTPPERTVGPQQAEVHGNRYVFAAATPYPNPHLPNPNAHHQYFHYNGYYPPPLPSPLPYDVHHQRSHASHDGPALSGWAYSGRRHHPNAGHVTHAPIPYVEHQKAVTIRNDVNLNKETLHMEPDEENPGRFLVAFTFDATNAGRISIFFFSKEGNDCSLASVSECFEPVTVSFKEGLGQKFRQPSGTGIDFSSYEEAELCKEGNLGVFPLAVKAEASSSDEDGNQTVLNSQITKAVFEKKEKDCYQVRVIKQILWVNSTRYELQEIYGIGNSVDNDFDGSDQGKECVICLSEPRDTTVLPCRHMEQYQVLLEYVLLKVKDSEAAEARQRCRVIVGSEGGRIACAVKRLRSPD